MNCCVSSCNSTNKNNSDIVTFHKFPAGKVRRDAWLAVLGMKESQLSDAPVVCSLHFKDENFYEGKNSMRVVHKCAMPFVQVCMVCLNTESKLYPLSKYNLEQTYETITGLSLQDLTNFTPTVCPECAQRMINCFQFRKKSMRAHAVLLDLIKKHESLTVPYIKTINRSHNHFTSNLVKKAFIPNYCDYNFMDNKEEVAEIELEVKEKKTIVKEEEQDHVIVCQPEAINENDKDVGPEDLAKHDMKDDLNLDIDIDIDFMDDNNDNDNDDGFFYKDDDDEPLNDNAKHLNVKGDKQSVDNSELEESESEVEFVDKIDNDDGFFYKDDDDEPLNDNARHLDVKNDKQSVDNIKLEESESEVEFVDKNDDDENSEKLPNKCNRTLRKNTKTSFASVKSVRNTKVKSKTQMNSKRNLTKKVSTAKTKIDKSRAAAVKSENKVNTKKSKGAKPRPVTRLTLFKLTTLSHEEQIQDIEKRKESSNYKFSSFQCNLCYRGFICNSTYTRHMIKHSKACGTVECPICKKYFKNQGSLSKHTKSHIIRYTCTLCEFFSMNFESARMHEQWHQGTTYKCPHCEDLFAKYTTYITHLRVKHPSDFICSHCGYSFISQKGLEYHMYRTHRLDKVALQEQLTGPHCEECNIRFASDTAYEQHMKVSPKHHKPEMRVRNQLLPSRRYKKANPVAYVVCEQCGARLKDFIMYMYHFKREHPGKNQTQHAPRPRECLCEQCGRSFQTSYHLKDHMSKHTGQKNFQCDVCEKRFRTKAFLDKHKETHATTRKLYKCHVCSKSFTSPSSRNRHMLIHKEKAYKCDICDKAFSNGSDRNTHVSHVHMKVPWPKRNRGPSGKAARQEKDTYE